MEQEPHHQQLALERLVAITSSCLLNEMRYYDNDEQRKNILLKLLKEVEGKDPEFIPQLAVYLRRELGLRTTPNFLMAFCACSSVLAKLLPNYFAKAVLLPSDTIEVTQFVQIIYLLQSGMEMDTIKELNAGDSFEIRRNIFVPNQLKKALTAKILSYSEYQLGKYCSESSRKAVLQAYTAARKGQLPYKTRLRKVRQAKETEKNKDVGEAKITKKITKARTAMRVHQINKQFRGSVAKQKAIEKTFLTMKDVVGLLHIKPTLLTSAILGVKYPSTPLEFEKKFPGEIFKEESAGKRMKIKTPVTWETELSSKGNSQEVWQSLLEHNKVPYLALLRNLRNIVKANVSSVLCQKVASFISSKENVIKNRATPLQYLSAFESVSQQMGEQRYQRRPAHDEQEQMEKESQMGKSKPFSPQQDQKVKLLSQAVVTALEHSMVNVDKLKGVTIVFTDVSGSMGCPLSGGKKYGSVRTCADLSILFGLMVNENCQQCKYYIFSSQGEHPKCYKPVSDLIKEGTIFQKMERIKEERKSLGGGTDFPTEVIQQLIDSQEKVDNIIIFSDMMISNGPHSGIASSYIRAINCYKDKVNSKVKVFSVDLQGYSNTLETMQDLRQKNFVRIYGANASILKFISESEKEQVAWIRNYAATLES